MPLAIKNNVPGADAEVVAKYEEPTWNNPVARFFAADGVELLARQDGVWAEPALVERTARALAVAKADVPLYFQTLVTETTGGPTQDVLFSMY